MRSRRPLRMALVLAVQVAILAAIPVRQVRARLDGTVVTLETVPFNPFDVLSGYYATLRYAAETPPGLAEARLAPGDTAFIVLERAEPAWRAVGVAREPSFDRLRTSGAGGGVAVRAVMTRRGLESSPRAGSTCRSPAAPRWTRRSARGAGRRSWTCGWTRRGTSRSSACATASAC